MNSNKIELKKLVQCPKREKGLEHCFHVDNSSWWYNSIPARPVKNLCCFCGMDESELHGPYLPKSPNSLLGGPLTYGTTTTLGTVTIVGNTEPLKVHSYCGVCKKFDCKETHYATPGINTTTTPVDNVSVPFSNTMNVPIHTALGESHLCKSRGGNGCGSAGCQFCNKPKG